MKRVLLVLVLLVIWCVGTPVFQTSVAYADEQGILNTSDDHDSGGQDIVVIYGANDDGNDGDPGDLGDGYGMTSDTGDNPLQGYTDVGLSWEEIMWLLMIQFQLEL